MEGEGGIFGITQEISVLLPSLPVEELQGYINRSIILHSPIVQIIIPLLTLIISFFVFQFRISGKAYKKGQKSPRFFSSIRAVGYFNSVLLTVIVFLAIQFLAPPFLPSELPYAHIPIEDETPVDIGDRIELTYTVTNNSDDIVRDLYLSTDLHPNISIIPSTLIIYTYGNLDEEHIPFVTERDLLVPAGELRPGESFIVQYDALIHEDADETFDQHMLIRSSEGNELITKTIYVNTL